MAQKGSHRSRLIHSCGWEVMKALQYSPQREAPLVKTKIQTWLGTDEGLATDVTTRKPQEQINTQPWLGSDEGFAVQPTKGSAPCKN